MNLHHLYYKTMRKLFLKNLAVTNDNMLVWLIFPYRLPPFTSGCLSVYIQVAESYFTLLTSSFLIINLVTWPWASMEINNANV